MLVMLHAPIAKRLAVLSGAGDEADDVVQEAFVKAYQALPRFREGAGLPAVAAADRRQRDAQPAPRARSPAGWAPRRGWPPRPPYRGVPDPADDAVSRRPAQRALLARSRALPADLREVVTCRYLLELSEAETAQALGIPAGTVKSRLHRALASLREVMADA